jgi:hypothetical protein
VKPISPDIKNWDIISKKKDNESSKIKNDKKIDRVDNNLILFEKFKNLQNEKIKSK